MLDFMIQVVLWTLIIYISIEIARIIIYYWVLPNENKKNPQIIITVNNCEDYIEGYLRSLIFRIRHGKEKHINKIIIIDLDSKDNTKSIIEKLERDYEFIKLIDLQEYKNITDLKEV